MDFAEIIPESRKRAMTDAGLWPNRLVTETLDDARAACPEQVALVARGTETGRTTTFSYRQLGRMIDRAALGLVALGVEKGEVVSYQLPNWWQFTVLSLACIRIGAVTNPLMPIFRERELEFMLSFAESKVMVVPRSFRGFDYPAMMERLRPRLPAMKHLLIVENTPQGSPGSFEQVLSTPRWEAEMNAARVFAERAVAPDDVMEVQYTSGTTGLPKGVLHTHNTLLGNLQTTTKFNGIEEGDVVLMASPLAHQTGYLYGMLMPIFIKGKSVLQDVWNPEVAAQLIEDEGVNFTMGATPFLADLMDLRNLTEYDLNSLRIFLTAGAPIPRVLVQRAGERLGSRIVSGWGMTENGVVTATKPDDPPEKVFGTDGCAVPGMEIRIVDEENKPIAADQEGRLQTRGVSQFVGYLKKPELYGHDQDGWFETGDLARMDAEGYIRIVGRSKDLLIRGGENIPVIEVEQLLYQHPAIQELAIVGMPDERLGERGCAFAVLRPGEEFSMGDMVAHLEAARMARQYFPERLEILGEMPRTATGKIQKFRLREMAAELVD